ncbi:hypothetical protein CD158_09810 [Staphylococcus auricularis]|uniref:Uncharacterized protein n=1 Tax=Staphylococcus auricularis TaxID=29379 RepID=A0AAP8PP03_9STAP|nr:hypothetical protein CD158_09810 [Staphylococcus auricularis]SQJ06590.1 Uncharacterised protein [Staphylococcus auricularis]
MNFLVTQTTFSFSTMIVTVLNILLFVLAIYLIYRAIKHFNTVERIDKHLAQLIKIQQRENNGTRDKKGCNKRQVQRRPIGAKMNRNMHGCHSFIFSIKRETLFQVSLFI